MNVYDLDGTILTGDSEDYFFKYCFKNLKLSRKSRLYFKFYGFIHKYFKVDVNITRPKQYYFLNEINDIDQLLKEFWDEHMQYVKEYYLKQHKDDDIISTASPLFLELELAKRLNIKYIQGTDMDKHTGKLISGVFNYGNEKLNNIKKIIDINNIDEFYSDSLTDTPLASVAKKAFFVNGDNIEPWPNKE